MRVSSRPTRGGGLAALCLLLAACGSEGAVEPTGPPAPTLTTLAPATAAAGSDLLFVTLNGTGFQPNSTVEVDGATRPSLRISESQLQVTLEPALLSVPGTRAVRVVTPAPGGGRSAELAFTVLAPTPPPQPVLDSVTPGHAELGSAGFALRVHGEGFAPTSVVRLGGQPRPTEYVDAATLRATILAGDLGLVRNWEVTVETPAPGGGVSAPRIFRVTPFGVIDIRRINFTGNGMLYDPTRDRIYISTPGSAGAGLANRVVGIVPSTLQIDGAIFVGSEPGQMVLSDDARFLYVALLGAPLVRRIDLVTREVDATITLPSDETGQTRAADLAVLPGQPRAVAVALRYDLPPFPGAGIRVFDDEVMRPVVTPPDQGGVRIEALSGTELIGLRGGPSPILYRLAVDAAGVRMTSFQASPPASDFTLAGGRLYFSGGAVMDPVTLSLVRQFQNFDAPIYPAPADGRLYATVGGGVRLYDLDSGLYLAQLSLNGLDGPFTRWGRDGFAMVANGELVLLRSSLIPVN